MQKDQECLAKECNRSAYSRGMCLKHYKRWQKWGDPNLLGKSPDDSSLEFRLNRHGWFVDDNGCWNWLGRIIRSGYGQVDWNASSQLAHRAAYMVWRGDIPEGLFVCHSCDNRKCINPDHLWLGTNKDNMLDMVSKGRGGILYGEAVGTSRFKEHEIREMYRLYKEDGKSITQISKLFQTGPSMVSAVVNGKTWKHLNILSH